MEEYACVHILVDWPLRPVSQWVQPPRPVRPLCHLRQPWPGCRASRVRASRVCTAGGIATAIAAAGGTAAIGTAGAGAIAADASRALDQRSDARFRPDHGIGRPKAPGFYRRTVSPTLTLRGVSLIVRREIGATLCSQHA